MRKSMLVLSVFAAVSLVLAACGSLAPTPAPLTAEQMVASLTAMASNPTATTAPTSTPVPPTSTPVPTLAPATCPNSADVTIVWPGFDSPNDENRYGVGYGQYKKVCFPNGGSVLASYIRVDGKTYDSVLKCDRNRKPNETCGYLLNVPPGKVVEFHDGVAGTIYPDPNGELNGPDGITMHPWLVDLTAKVFPYKP